MGGNAGPSAVPARGPWRSQHVVPLPSASTTPGRIIRLPAREPAAAPGDDDSLRRQAMRDK